MIDTTGLCYCGCLLPQSGRSEFAPKHMRFWIDQLADDCLPDFMAGHDISHITAPHAAILTGRTLEAFNETLVKRRRIAHEGFNGQNGILLKADKVCELLLKLRDAYWTGARVLHRKHGYGTVAYVADQAHVVVAFDDKQAALLPSGNLIKVGVDYDEQ